MLYVTTLAVGSSLCSWYIMLIARLELAPNHFADSEVDHAGQAYSNICRTTVKCTVKMSLMGILDRGLGAPTHAAHVKLLVILMLSTFASVTLSVSVALIGKGWKFFLIL